MIVSFRHKGLEAYFKTGSKRGIQAQHARKLTLILTALNVAKGPDRLDSPAFRLHPLKGALRGH